MNFYRPSKLSNRFLIDGIPGAFMASYDGGIRKGIAGLNSPRQEGKRVEERRKRLWI